MTQTCKLIDIIIPAFNAHQTIIRTLGSIMSQTIVDNCVVTIVNDYGNDYKDIIKQFSNFMTIQEICLSENKGPGAARQAGIDNTSCPYFTMIDADDSFNGPVALEILLGTFQHYPNCNLVISSFIEQLYKNNQLEIVKFNKNMIWVFGKLYKRTFIENNKIRFNDTRSNEDTGFNTLFELCLPNVNEDEIVYLDDPLYVWHFNTKSITRQNNNEYTFNENLPGYVENMIYAISEAEKRNPFNEEINKKKIDVMVALYFLYCGLANIHPEFKKNYLLECVRFYNEIVKKQEERMDKDDLSKQIMDSFNKRISLLKDIRQELTLGQFLPAIRSAPYERKTD